MEAFVNFLLSLSPQTPELRFLLAAVVVVAAGSRLSRYGDVFSEKLGIGQAFVGLIFMAFATALPELITSLSSAIIQNAPNLALGNNFGSILFNISIIAALEFLLLGPSIFSRVDNEVIAPGVFSILMISLGALALLPELILPGATPVFGAVGLGSLVILAAYAVGMRFLQRHHAASETAGEDPSSDTDASLAATSLKYLLAVAFIAWAGVNLARAGDDLALKYSLSKSFVGTVFLAVVTSLPEVSATVIMVRRGMYEMAFGNIFGSNAFNIAILAFVDVLYRKGYLFGAAAAKGRPAAVHLVSAAFAVAMTLVILAAAGLNTGKVVRTPPPAPGTDRAAAGNFFTTFHRRLSWPSIIVLALFLAGEYVAFVIGG